MKYSIVVCLLIVVLFTTTTFTINAKSSQQLVLDSSTIKTDIYDDLYVLYDDEQTLTIDDVSSPNFENEFIHYDRIIQKTGYHNSIRWLRFEVANNTEHSDWILEFAFSLIYVIDLYTVDENGITHIQTTGSNFPFHNREIKNRYFALNLEVEPQDSQTYYVAVNGGGDLYPPIRIWDETSFLEKTQVEFSLLGLFYGMILVMIMYNFFLFFALRIKSYLYYVIAITFTLIGNLSADGLAYQYLWPNAPIWNAHASVFWVTITCIFILIFTHNFLDSDIYVPKFKWYVYGLISLNTLVLIILVFSRNLATNLMTIVTLLTFLVVLTVGFISLKRGARQARFFVVGWVIFLVGVSITILERIAIIPYSTFTEYAGQITLAFEVMLLSFALADKINLMRIEKSQAKQEALESQKTVMESLQKADELKDDFLAVTSHELKTPLYGMIGIAESLRDGITGKVSPTMRDQLEIIIASGDRLTHLVNDILDLTKLKNDSLTVELKPVHLHGLVTAIFTICQPLIKDKKVNLINNIPESLTAILADSNRLQQIFYNLIGNAIKYTDKGEVSISVKEIGDKVKIFVTDTGHGIPKRLQKQIFKPFIQGEAAISRRDSGTGIGLNITSELINLHGGTIEVNSTLGKGTTFCFSLPISSEVKSIDEIALTVDSLSERNVLINPPKNITVRNQSTILVADDEPVNLQVLTNQLYLEGYKVITALSGENVLDIVSNHDIDLVILDIMMPRVSGYEVCQQLREIYSLMELPILMLTAKNQTRDRVMAFELGANDYLAKPCDKSELISRVKTLVKLKSLNQELFIMNVKLEEKVKERTFDLENANIDLSKMNDNLVAMSKSRRQLLANIAHELGTPIMMVHSYLQALQEGLINTDDVYYNELVFEKITLLNRLINDLSDLSKLEAGQASLDVKRIDLYEWLEHTCNKIEFDVKRLGRLYGKTNQLVNKLEFICFLDTIRMDQVFTNLISNAIKNTDGVNGKITLSASINQQRNRLTIKFSDNGIGIDEQQLAFLFERFYKSPKPISSDKTTGTGLGLAIVKEIILGHNGTIEAESELNIGTSFYITLPIQKIKH